MLSYLTLTSNPHCEKLGRNSKLLFKYFVYCLATLTRLLICFSYLTCFTTSQLLPDFNAVHYTLLQLDYSLCNLYSRLDVSVVVS